MRVTTTSLLHNYNRHLARADYNVATARNKVLTGRNYMYASENPGEVAKAYQLRNNYENTENSIENIENIQAIFDNMEGAMMNINKSLEEVKAETLEGFNGATGMDARKTFAQSLRQKQESIVLNLNSLFGDRYVFGGQDTAEPPFKLDNGKLLYRGIDVNSQDPADQQKLKDLSDEKLYMNIGFGLKEDINGALIGDTAFNVSFPGLNVTGYGENADGISKNIVTLLGEIADELENPDFDSDRYTKLSEQIKESKDVVLDVTTQLGNKSNFLETTKIRHEDSLESINEKLSFIEVANPAEAISDYMWYQYAYSSALKAGTSVIPQSVFDFMQ